MNAGRFVAIFLMSLVALLDAPCRQSAAADFRIQTDPQRTWVVAPDGRKMILLGVNHVDLAESVPIDQRAAFFAEAADRLRNWGFNNLGYSTPPALRDVMPFLIGVQLYNASQANTAAEFRYPDVFDPAWQRDAREKIRRLCAQTASHPNLIGYYWTDTPRWDISLARQRRGDDWPSAIRRLPAAAAGKIRYVAFLRDRYANDPAKFSAAYGHSIASFDDLLAFDFREFDRNRPSSLADDREFLRLIARELYRVCGEAFREFAPGKLIFGERYKLHDYPDEVLAEAARWIDVLSIQPGPTAGPLPGPGRDEVDFDAAEFDRLHALTGKPILICDHQVSFCTPEHPVTLWHQFPTEAAAADATERFVRAALAKPYIVGWQRCQYRDSFHAERGNMLKQGLVQADGQPHAVITARLAKMNRELAESLQGLPPQNSPDSMFATDQYQLLDFGDGRRLERFGTVTLDRPCPAAERFPRADPDAWAQADARFEGRAEETGQWTDRRELPERWTIAHGPLTFELKRTDFGHLGLFPEQATNWDWIARQISASPLPLGEGQGEGGSETERSPHPQPLSQRERGDRLKVLNLFAYTGGSTLAAAAAGAEVVHVDAAKNIVAWARRNAELSGLAGSPIRWIAEDAMKFVKREIKRGSRYDAVILDPPSYGHGPRGETWRLAKHLPRLLSLCAELTSGRPKFMLMTCHTPGYEPEVLRAMIGEAFGNEGTTVGEPLTLRSTAGGQLPSGSVVRLIPCNRQRITIADCSPNPLAGPGCSPL